MISTEVVRKSGDAQPLVSSIVSAFNVEEAFAD